MEYLIFRVGRADGRRPIPVTAGRFGLDTQTLDFLHAWRLRAQALATEKGFSQLMVDCHNLATVEACNFHPSAREEVRKAMVDEEVLPCTSDDAMDNSLGLRLRNDVLVPAGPFPIELCASSHCFQFFFHPSNQGVDGVPIFSPEIGYETLDALRRGERWNWDEV